MTKLLCCQRCHLYWVCDTKWYRGEKGEEQICCPRCRDYRRCNTTIDKKPQITPAERRNTPRIKNRFKLNLEPNKDRWQAVKNISAGGLCFDSNEDINLEHILEFRLRDSKERTPQAPQAKAKVVWSKKLKRGRLRRDRYRIGGEFFQIEEEERDKITQKVKENLAGQKRLKKVFSYILLAAAFFGFFGLSIYQYRGLKNMNSSWRSAMDNWAAAGSNLRILWNKERTLRLDQEVLLSATIKARDGLKDELTEAKIDLWQAERLLKDLTLDKVALEKEVTLLKDSLSVLELEVARLNNENQTLSAKFSNLKELKTAIRELRRRSYLAKVKVQKELDRIALERGNRGFIIKDSQATIGPRKAVIKVLAVE